MFLALYMFDFIYRLVFSYKSCCFLLSIILLISNIKVVNVIMVAKKSAIISDKNIPSIPKKIGNINVRGIKITIFLKTAMDKDTKAWPKAIKVVCVASC